MKWDYDQFQNQPAWFIDMLIIMINAEEEAKINANKKTNNQE